jgi:high-affinity iron transporter
VLGNYLIGLREGIEAALVISILITYLVRTGRTGLIRQVWYGVIAAIVVSIIIATALESISSELAENLEPIFAGVVSFVAVGFVTWMIFWMKRSARTISSDLRAQLDSAALAGGGLAVAGMSFVAVLREGAETAVFFWAAAHATGNQVTALLGLVLGLATAAVVGWVFYRSTATINLKKFFKITGILLVFVAAGVLSYGIHEFQEVGLLPGEDNVILDLSNILTDGSILSTLAAGIFNLKPTTTALQVIGYLVYSATVLYFLLRNGSNTSGKTSVTPEVSASVEEPAR